MGLGTLRHLLNGSSLSSRAEAAQRVQREGDNSALGGCDGASLGSGVLAASFGVRLTLVVDCARLSDFPCLPRWAFVAWWPP